MTRRRSPKFGACSASIAVMLFVVALPSAQTKLTTPKEAIGFNFGDDYHLANYKQIAAYWHQLARESDRIVVQEIGKTAEGRPHLMAIVTSPANHKNLARYKDISRRLAKVEDLTDEQARALAKEGKAVVWIDGGLHATETLGAQQLGEMVYQMVSRTDEETMRFLNDCVMLFVHANPDGNDLVADWYMRNPVPEKRSTAGLPRLYQKYIGHDNNRDFFASTQAETENINRVLYHEWLPQILYNHHQSGPQGTVFWSSPQRDPYNYNLDPLLILGLQALGTHMHQRFAAEGKPGATMASGGPYDGWWNGGIRNTANFHNIIAILTEMVGSPTPMRIPLVMSRQLPSRDLPYPIAPQEWRFSQSIEYSITANRAVIDYAARNREHLLFNIYRMGKRSIERGGEDYWAPSPTRAQALNDKMQRESGSGRAGGRGGRTGRGGAGNADRDVALWAELRKPELRDPRGFVIPSNQPDFPTATKFINALREVGITVHRATGDFEAGGKRYPAGSYVVFAAQAFRPHVIDMFEPQDHPNVFPVPGGPPTPPYDNAGWTLAFQMGIEFDRLLEPFSGPFEKIADWNVKPPAGKVSSSKNAAGYLVSHRVLDSFTALNRLLAAGEEVYWLQSPITANGQTYPAGAWYVRARPKVVPIMQKAAADLGVSFEAVGTPVSAGALRLKRPRIGLWDQYTGSMDAGWARWILEQFEFPFERTFPPMLDAGNLSAKYDVLVFVDGGIPAQDGGAPGGGRGGETPAAADIPAEYRAQLGRVTAERTLPELKRFVENGGSIVAIGQSAMNLARFLNLPLENHVVEDGSPVPRTKYYVPGSVLAARVDTTHPIGHGMKERTDVFFDNSPVFKLASGSGQGVKVIASFDTKTPLRSGWAWGQHYLEGGVAAVEARVGKGRVYLFGPEILQRAQPHGTFKFLFNSIYYGAAVAASPATSSSSAGR